MKSILYIGGFEMPDKNAAAQRVMSIAKALREAGYEILFYGITATGDFRGVVDGFHYEAYPHPNGTIAWIKYALGKGIKDYIRQKNPDYVFLYNYPAFAQERVISYCKMNGIRTIGDITEWYRPINLPKRIDTWYRMVVGNKKLDGIITISRYLSEYYKSSTIVQLPPLVDKREEKWQIKPVERGNDKIRLVYIGTGSIKDMLDKIIKGILTVGAEKFHLDVIGITQEQYNLIYQQALDVFDLNVNFHGRLPHRQALEYLLGADFQIFFRDYIRANNAGFPTKFVESMSAGIPVITNRISNIDDYLVDGENGFMIEKLDDKELTDVLAKVSDLTRNDIDNLKSRCLFDAFDYRKYIEPLKMFMQKIE